MQVTQLTSHGVRFISVMKRRSFLQSLLSIPVSVFGIGSSGHRVIGSSEDVPTPRVLTAEVELPPNGSDTAIFFIVKPFEWSYLRSLSDGEFSYNLQYSPAGKVKPTDLPGVTSETIYAPSKFSGTWLNPFRFPERSYLLVQLQNRTNTINKVTLQFFGEKKPHLNKHRASYKRRRRG